MTAAGRDEKLIGIFPEAIEAAVAAEKSVAPSRPKCCSE
jgi:hypothetical protein